jgi:ClpP class serine protease
VQGDIYQAFCRQVRARRGDKLKAAEADIFNGRFWSGSEALALGLIDGIGEMRTVMRARFGEKVKLRLVGERQSWWRRRLGLTLRPPAVEAEAGALLDGLIAVADERAAWSRYGL